MYDKDIILYCNFVIQNTMEKLIDDKLFKQLQYVILGKEQQVLNVVLAPGQGIYVDESRIICCSEGATRTPVRTPFCGEPLEYHLDQKAIDTLPRSGGTPTLLLRSSI